MYCELYQVPCEEVIGICLSPEEDIDITYCKSCEYCIDDEEED